MGVFKRFITWCKTFTFGMVSRRKDIATVVATVAVSEAVKDAKVLTEEEKTAIVDEAANIINDICDSVTKKN